MILPGLVCVSTTFYHYTISTSLYCSPKLWWSLWFILFMHVSQPTISMLEQKLGFVSQCRSDSHIVCCCFRILFLVVRLGLLLLFIAFNVWVFVFSWDALLHVIVSTERCLQTCSPPVGWNKFCCSSMISLAMKTFLWWPLTGRFLALCTVVVSNHSRPNVSQMLETICHQQFCQPYLYVGQTVHMLKDKPECRCFHIRHKGY